MLSLLPLGRAGAGAPYIQAEGRSAERSCAGMDPQEKPASAAAARRRWQPVATATMGPLGARSRILVSLLFGALNSLGNWYDPARDESHLREITNEIYRMFAGAVQ